MGKLALRLPMIELKLNNEQQIINFRLPHLQQYECWQQFKSTEMLQILEMSHNEKIEMYRKVDKEELIQMIIEANNHLSRLLNSNICHCRYSETNVINGKHICTTCNKQVV